MFNNQFSLRGRRVMREAGVWGVCVCSACQSPWHTSSRHGSFQASTPMAQHAALERPAALTLMQWSSICDSWKKSWRKEATSLLARMQTLRRKLCVEKCRVTMEKPWSLMLSCWVGHGMLSCQLHLRNNCEKEQNSYLVFGVFPFPVEPITTEGIMHVK